MSHYICNIGSIPLVLCIFSFFSLFFSNSCRHLILCTIVKNQTDFFPGMGLGGSETVQAIVICDVCLTSYALEIRSLLFVLVMQYGVVHE